MASQIENTIFICSTNPINNLPTKIDEEEAEPAKEIESDKAVLSLPSAAAELSLLSVSRLWRQMQLLALANSETSCKIAQLFGFQPVGYGNLDDEICLLYFSSPNVIKLSLEIEKKCLSKAMKITPCATSDDEAIANVVNSQSASSATVHYIIDNSS
ncbi:hypothetical protein PS6_005938 [Mucor atramentarius]